MTVTELEKIQIQLERFKDKTFFTQQEIADFTILCLNALRIRIDMLEERVSKLENKLMVL